ncbi:hypothetical protein [Stenotrophomonas oahuensis]|uniref:Uncharacterized protein n=1 Tax=Stenotrophomonas oahuensis TaxID=3003271 RepID=A0ABY9YME7_9GAMM|nr:hypothetical protein [Stenotrophomonas sp. A5586]WNH51888.1 hypothetical protein PDM29_16305 [Stenotrophomonas sp. A5586]
MTSKTPRYEHIGIHFEPPAMYVSPMEGYGAQLATIHTTAPFPDADAFSYTLNGIEGPVPNVKLFFFHQGGGVRVEPEFIESYDGPWPAQLEVIYSKNGKPADLGRLPLLNPLTAVAAYMRIAMSGSPCVIPQDDWPGRVAVNPHVYDANHIPITYMHGVEVQLLDHDSGIAQNRESFSIYSNATPGDYRVRITTIWGLEETVTFTLVSGAPI